MSIIFSDDINDNRGEDLSKRVDTIYDYIAYMKEQLEFWARNRTREISGADAKIDSAVEDIAENTEAIAENADAIADLEPRIQVYEDNLPIDGTGITAHKPIAFDGVPSSALSTIGWQYVGKTIGNILQAPNEASSYGQAVVFRDVMTGLYRIEFECNIDGVASSGSSNFTFGLYRDFIINTVGVKIDPISDIGYWRIWDNGTNNFNYSGYAPVFQKFIYNTASNKAWRFARVYNTSGGVGGWGNGSMASVSGRHYKGVCYGRHED